MALLEITELQSARPDRDIVRAFGIDHPPVGAETDADRFLLDGWVLGQRRPAVAIEVRHGATLVARIAVEQPRPDVAADHLGALESCGFRGSVSLVGLGPDVKLDVRAILDGGESASLAMVRCRRLLLGDDAPDRRFQEAADDGEWPKLHLDRPDEGADLAVGGVVTGWAFSPVGIRAVSLWLDGAPLGAAAYGLAREDLEREQPGWPAAPRAGFRFPLEALPAGAAVGAAAALEVVAEDWLGRRAAVPRAVRLAASARLPAAGSLDQPEERGKRDVLRDAGWAGHLVVHGWAVDPAGVDTVEVLIDDRVAATAEYGLPREDVDALRPGYRRLGLTGRSGWLAVIPTGDVAPGQHAVTAVLKGGSGDLVLGQSRVTIRPESVRADRDRQRRLDALLRCPRCRGGFVRGDDRLVCRGCGLRIPTSEYGTLLFDETYAGLDWRKSVSTSHAYPPMAQEVIEECRDGLVLEVGAGLHESLGNVVQLDAIAYPTTDVSANGEAMPFADESFDGVIACNLLEHVTSPASVVAEMRRVCKIGGRIYADSTTVHPYHGFPHHYFNATENGLAWLMTEVGGAEGTAESADARTTIRLVLQSWLGSMEDDATRASVAETRIGDLVGLLQTPAENPALYESLGDLSPLGRRLIPPKVMFGGTRLR